MSFAAPPIVRSAAPVISTDEAVRELEQHLFQTRRKVIRQRVGTGALRLVSLGAVALGLIAALDYWLELATPWRGLGLLFVVGGTVAAAIAGWRRTISSYTLPETAKDAERRAAEFGQRLRTTLDYEYDDELPRPAAASRGLLDALHAETHQVSQRTDWDALVDQCLLRRALVVAAVGVTVWMIALIALPEFRIAAGRALLLPWNYTTVTYTPQASTIKIGQSVTVRAEVSGRPIAAATVRHRTAGSKEKWRTLDLIADESVEVDGELLMHGLLSATLDNLEQDQEFEVLAGPRALPLGAIRVLQPLKLTGAQARITPPAYTGCQVETVQELNLKVLEGSTVDIEISLNRPAAEGQLMATATGSGQTEVAGPAAIPLTCVGSTLRARLVDLRTSATYTIAAKAADDMVLDPVPLKIKVQLDRPPSVQFLAPPEELAVIPTAEVRMIVEAADDLGLYKAGVLYQVGSGPLQPLWEANADGSTKPVRGAPVLKLENLALTFQDAITYYAFAEDNYFGQSRRTTTPLRFIDIRPYKLEFQLTNGNCSCNGQSVTLEELIQRQRQQLSAAFSAEQRSAPPPEVIQRLAAGEADLLAKTEEFWLGMVALAGPIPTLDEAVKHMQGAVSALQTANLAEGVSAEQQALAALVRSRENLRQKLSQSSSASQCQKFDRQQQQKLRKPEKEQQDKEQQVAEARKKLSELAEREREWSKQAQQACQNPSGSKSGQPKPSSSSASSSATSSSSPGPMPMPTSDSVGEKSASETSSPESLAEAQEKMLEELKEIQKQLPQLSKSGEAAQQQAEQAAASMQQGLDELKREQGTKAAAAGERSAEELDQLAAHLAAMNAKDLGERLKQAQQLAKQLTAGQEVVEKQLEKGQANEGDQGDKPQGGKSGKEKVAGSKLGGEEPGDERPSENPGNTQNLTAEERHLAAEARLLAEQLTALERDAATELGGIGQKLSQLASDTPPGEIAAAMEQAAEDLQGNRTNDARRGVSQTREQLQELSQQLGAARNQFSQPQLEELQKLEEQLAQLMERSDRARSAGSKPGPTDSSKWQELAARLEALAGGDKRLAEALRRLLASENRLDSQRLPPGIYPEMELLDTPIIRDVAKALQAKIQEAILASGLMDADQPVPPQYKDLVEKYYRALSDDLR